MRRVRSKRLSQIRNWSATIESLEQRLLLSAEFRTIDGTGNNLDNIDWGAAEVQQIRIADPAYDDAIGAPNELDQNLLALPNPRSISNDVFAQDVSITNDRLLSDFAWQWGQFVDHDIVLTDTNSLEPFAVQVPTGDPLFDPFATGTASFAFDRSIYDTSTGHSEAAPRQQINQITAYIDASNVYGSDEVRAAELRTFEDGKLKTSEGDLLPFNTAGLPNAGGTSDALFLGGDVRANEQNGLTALHTLFVREHNRLAEEIQADKPWLSDEEIYQEARAYVGALMQVITYNDFLPALLGPDAIPAYEGYNPDVDPGITNTFSTASYRFGHSMLSATLLRRDNSGEVIAEEDLPLRDAFFNPQHILDTGIEPLLKGLSLQPAQEIDAQLVDDVRNFLFGPPGAGGFDLAALNIQRGRDHGLPDYNSVRVAYGLSPVEDFSDITSNAALVAALTQAYGSVDRIDAWVGGLAEDHVPGASVGELVSTVLARQFTALRDGDRFWYENQFSGGQLRELNRTTLADVIERNTNIDSLQRNVFFVPTSPSVNIAIEDVVFPTNEFRVTSTTGVAVDPAGDRLHVESVEIFRSQQERQALQLDRDLDLYVDKATVKHHYYQDWGGLDEKYIKGDDGWYYVLPDGNLYEWNGAMDRSTWVAELDSSFHDDPQQLTDAIQRRPAIEVEVEAEMTAAGRMEYFVLIGRDQRFVETVHIALTISDGDSSTEDLFDVTFDQPDTEHFALLAEAYRLDQELKLYVKDSDLAVDLYFNDGGQQEKYIRGRQGWYYLLPTGELYQWRGNIANSRKLATLNPSFYEDPSRLYNAIDPHSVKDLDACFALWR